MIVDAIYGIFAQERQVARGNPTSSRFGTCTAQLQQLLYPEVSRPEPFLPGALMTFEHGHKMERWVTELEDRAFRGKRDIYLGLTHEPFYFPVPISDSDIEPIRRKLEARVVWGTVQADFEPPRVWEDAGVLRTRLLACRACDKRGKDHGWPCGKRLGLVLDSPNKMVWAMTEIDRLVRFPEVGLAPREIKAVSTPIFRRALRGEISYPYRCQLAGQQVAMGLDTAIHVFIRKETGRHMLEVIYTRKADRTRIEVTTTTGSRQVFYVVSNGALTTEPSVLAEIPSDAEYACVWSPFDDALVNQIQERIRRVLLVGPSGPWWRENGPNFLCKVCDGTGRQTHRKGSPGHPLKEPKPCETCGASGQCEEASLPWECSYCPVTPNCYAPAKVRLEVTDKPTYWIRRADFEASGIVIERRGEPEEEPSK